MYTRGCIRLPNCTNTKWTIENITTKDIRTALISEHLITQDLEHVRIKFNFTEAVLNTKGSWIARILLCLKHDLQPELGSGLPSRWRLRPTLPGSRVTRRAWRLATLAWRKWRSRKKKSRTVITT